MEVPSPGPKEEETPVNPDDRYRSLVESGPDPLFVDVGGRIVFANRAFNRMMGGADPGDFIGRSPLEWVPSEVREQLAAFLEEGRRRAEGQSFAVEPIAWRLVNGSPLDVEAVAGPVDWTGQTGVQVTLREIQARRQREHSLFQAGFTKVAQDNTQRKQTEAALRASEARYRELAAEMERRVADRTRHLEQSIQTWESFCYSIAHDLRAPLRSISGFAGALLDDYGRTLDPTGQAYAERMLAAANRLDEFIQDLLDFGRLAHAELPPDEVDLNRCLQQVLTLLADEISTTRAEIRFERPLPSVWGNAAALNQVLANLLSNAIKFVAPGSTPRVEIRAEESNGLVRLWFQDHGIGISPAHQDRIFELFERLHPHSVYPGTGVGLAIVRKAMERMGGQVGLQSEAGAGTAFWIELPVVGSNGPLKTAAQSSSGGTLP
jgi:PAS domain S-box-containing protein